MGSSMVMMWRAAVWLRCSTRAARVVDLPDPEAPVTNTSPLGNEQSSYKSPGRCRSCRVGIRARIGRRAAASPWECRKTLMRKRRLVPDTSQQTPKSTLPLRSSSRSNSWPGITCRICASVMRAVSRDLMTPFTRALAGLPAERKRSEESRGRACSRAANTSEPGW